MKQVDVNLIQLPKSNGFKYVIVLINYFSKLTEAELILHQLFTNL